MVGSTVVVVVIANRHRRFPELRKLGVTVREVIDVVIATRCIESGYDLLHDDRNFREASRVGGRVLTS